MHWIDWSIVGALVALLVFTLLYCRRFVRSTADFLAANRCAGRYLLTITSGIAGIGAISIIAMFELYYKAGFTPQWWGFLSGPLSLIIAITGWVYYRMRETRCLTMAQFFEVRYSRKFRIFSGFIGWLSGILNYGIFPAVSVKFFIYFCGLPDVFTLPGIPFTFSTYVCLLLIAMSMGVFFAINGGQVGIMLTDFIQGMFCNASFLILMVYLLLKFNWGDIFETLTLLHEQSPNASMADPFATTGIKDFNIWYFIMGIIGTIFSTGTWQGNSGYNASAKSAHEAKMANLLGSWRVLVQSSLVLFIPICAIVFFNSPKFAEEAQAVNRIIAGLHGQDVSQARVPLFLATQMPVGLIGLFAAVMFAAMLSTDDTSMHSWGSIFVQDVLLPFRKKPFTEKEHILALRLSIVFVGVFGFLFSYYFKQTEHILLFFQITGAIFMGGAGAVVIGGLYSRTGTTTGAWVAMILGSTLSLGSIALQQVWKPLLAPYLIERFSGSAFAAYVEANKAQFPLNGRVLSFGITFLAFTSYFVVSWIDRKVHGGKLFNLDKMLHRGEYDIAGEHQKSGWDPGRIWSKLGLTEEFSKFDRVIFFCSIGWTVTWFLVFIVLTFNRFVLDMTVSGWLQLWQIYLMLSFFIGVGTTVWFFVGGIVDIRRLFRTLATIRRNPEDNGQVVDGRNAGE